jgi:hypothetical protein
MTALLFGQMSDPNIAALRSHFDLFVDQSQNLHWDITTDTLTVDGHEINFNASFGRANVFAENNWTMYSNAYLISNYVRAHPNIKQYNPNYEQETPYKLKNLVLAKQCGLHVPDTEAGIETGRPDTIIKPITGGAHAAHGSRADYPVILQQRIDGLNKRLFVIGDDIFVFGLASTHLDYRDDPNPSLFVSEIDHAIVPQVRKLMGKINLTFGAADFIDDGNKTWFLEINSSPMFAAFNNVVAGKLAESLRANLK